MRIKWSRLVAHRSGHSQGISQAVKIFTWLYGVVNHIEY